MICSDAIPPENETPKLATAAELAAWFGVSTRTIMNWVRLEILPKPVRLSPRKNLFRVESVRAALNKLEQDRWTTADGRGHE